MADIHLLGIRHHGPGSCRNVLQALERIRPDLILLEGPAEAEALMPFVADSRMRPPVALLGYQPDAPQNAVFYPFAEFSPEWQVLCYAMREKVILRFFALPLAHSLAVFTTQTDEQDPERPPLPSHDPFDLLAEAAGYTDGETWWNMNIEQRRDNKDIFEAVKEAVSALREAQPEYTSRRDLTREAWMRRMIRAAQKEPFERIAVVCGAWHVPALENMPKVKDDNEQLKGLSKVKIECTWIPWTYDRLMFRSGYGAGITSPGWYDYLWSHPEDDGTLWVSRIAALLREKGMDISVAHVIETVRLAQATAALRGMPTPTLEEYNEAVTTVMGFGDDTLLQLVKENLVVSNRLGQVPDEVPKVPLLIDVERHQKRLRVPFTAEIKELTLDLRKENDLGRSLFFHRLALLDIDWAKPVTVEGKGTFKERWSLYHRPEQIVRIIEQAIWGNTLEEASQKYITHLMTEIEHIPELVEAGIDSLKIEGRMKTALYVATVARTYRKAIDDYFADPDLYEKNMDWYQAEISKCTYRQFTTGFFYGKPSEETQIYDNNTYEKGYTYLGIVGAPNEKGLYRMEQRNKFSVGEQIEIMKPNGDNVLATVLALVDEDGNEMESCPHPQQVFYVKLSETPDEFDILRRQENEAIALD